MRSSVSVMIEVLFLKHGVLIAETRTQRYLILPQIFVFRLAVSYADYNNLPNKDLSEDQFPQPMPQMIFFDIAPPSESSILLFALCSPLPILFQSDNVPRHGEVNVLLCF